jgi:hypothetical protein
MGGYRGHFESISKREDECEYVSRVLIWKSLVWNAMKFFDR